MIRVSKHNIMNITNQGKVSFLDELFMSYRETLITYIGYIVDDVLPLRVNLSSKLLPDESITHSRYKQLIYKHASSVVRSQTKKATERRFKRYKRVYSYFKESGRQTEFVNKKFSELTLKPIYKSRYFTIPNLDNLTITLDERFFDIKETQGEFDGFVKVITPFFN